MGSDDEKLDALSERIAKAQIASEAKPESPSTVVSSSGAGFDFAGSVVGSGIVGALMDRAFNTSPWCLLGMVILVLVSVRSAHGVQCKNLKMKTRNK